MEIMSSIKRICRKKDQLFDKNYIYSDVYGKIYNPIYNRTAEISSYVPKIYNEEGGCLELFFLRDLIRAHNPYSRSKYYFFDRYNFNLKTHFYSHNSMLEQMGKPDRKYGMLMESRSIVPRDYEIFKKNKGLEKDFDLIFTQSEYILNSIPNSRFVPFCSEVWYGTEESGGVWSPEAYKNKTKNISIVSSNKMMCPLHKLRYDLAMKYQNSLEIETFGTFNGGASVKLAETLTDFRYSIAIENEISNNWFTERITSCFASMTVPIYIGAPNIGKFFNEDGIIRISIEDVDNFDRVIKKCSQYDYEQRLPAIIDNYERVKEYINSGDYMYEHYIKDGR